MPKKLKQKTDQFRKAQERADKKFFILLALALFISYGAIPCIIIYLGE